MKSFKEVVNREVVGSNVIIDTGVNIYIYALSMWNLQGYRAVPKCIIHNNIIHNMTFAKNVASIV